MICKLETSLCNKERVKQDKEGTWFDKLRHQRKSLLVAKGFDDGNPCSSMMQASFRKEE
jgi:hypothetical protein